MQQKQMDNNTRNKYNILALMLQNLHCFSVLKGSTVITDRSLHLNHFIIHCDINTPGEDFPLLSFVDICLH